MKIGSFEFNLRELAGAFGDYGVLLPLAVGYIAINGLNPAGFLVMLGVANIVTGLVYKLPLPLEPMKVIAVVAIAQRWSPSMVYASGFAMGAIWLVFAVTGAIDLLGKLTPRPVVRAIQVALGVMLAVEAIKLMSTWWILGAISILIVLALRENRYAPAGIVLVIMGTGLVFIQGRAPTTGLVSFTPPPITGFRLDEVWQTLLLAGFAQIPLTVTNATIATSALISTYWPDRPVSERKLSVNQGIMNLIVPFFGGMPMCHGAGGLAGQYYFGARTGGTNIMEGTIYIVVGLFLATSIAGLLAAFPSAIIGAMMFLVGIEMARFARDVRIPGDLLPFGATVVVAVLTNMAFGFLVGLALHHLTRFVRDRFGTASVQERHLHRAPNPASVAGTEPDKNAFP